MWAKAQFLQVYVFIKIGTVIQGKNGQLLEMVIWISDETGKLYIRENITGLASPSEGEGVRAPQPRLVGASLGWVAMSLSCDAYIEA